MYIHSLNDDPTISLNVHNMEYKDYNMVYRMSLSYLAYSNTC